MEVEGMRLGFMCAVPPRCQAALKPGSPWLFLALLHLRGADEREASFRTLRALRTQLQGLVA
eukprot:2776072-Rhodomonas_salina.1